MWTDFRSSSSCSVRQSFNILRSVMGLTPKFRGIPLTFRMLKFMANFRIILKQIKLTVKATSRLIWFLSLHDTYKYKWSKSSFLQMVFRLFNAILLYKQLIFICSNCKPLKPIKRRVKAYLANRRYVVPVNLMHIHIFVSHARV